MKQRNRRIGRILAATACAGAVFLLSGCKKDTGRPPDPSGYAGIYAERENMKDMNKLHFTLPGYIGDVHPYYENGKLYLFYLKTDGNFSSALAISEDFLTYTDTELKHDNKLPLNPYYVLNVVIDGEWYRSFYGAGRIMASSRSRDLIHWEIGMETEDFMTLYQAANTYPCDGRDPYVFYDPDIGRYRLISTAYYTNAEWGRGEGMDAALALSTSIDGTPRQFEEKQKELLRFPDGYSGEPEVSQLMKIGDRWYLFVCMARRTEHFVGPVSYYIGDRGKTLDEIDWTAKEEYFLTGEDLCAAQLVEVEGRHYLFGWIPQQARGNAWGGSLNLPTEVYVSAEDGTLGTRLDPYLYGLLFEEDAGIVADSTKQLSGSIALQGEFKIPQEPETAAEYGLRFTGCGNQDGYEVRAVVLPGEGLLKICSGDGYVYSSIHVRQESGSGTVRLEAVLEDDILEIYYNGEAALCARLDAAFGDYRAEAEGYAESFTIRRIPHSGR